MDEKRQHWIGRRAAQLWETAGRPRNRDLEFWLAAESEHDHECKGQICVLGYGQCPYQIEQPTTGGRHISICTRPHDTKCRNRASNYNTKRYMLELAGEEINKKFPPKDDKYDVSNSWATDRSVRHDDPGDH